MSVSGQIVSSGRLTLESPAILGTLTLQGGEATIPGGAGTSVSGGLINRASMVQNGSITITGLVINDTMGAWGNTGGPIQINPGGMFLNRGDLLVATPGQTLVSGVFEQAAGAEMRVTEGGLALRGTLSIAGDCAAVPLGASGAEIRIGSVPGDSTVMVDPLLFTAGLGEIRLNDGGIRIDGTLRTGGTADPSAGVRFEGGALYAAPAASIDASDSNPFVIDCDPNEGAVLGVSAMTNSGPLVWRRGSFLLTPSGSAFVNSGIGTIRVAGGFARRIGGAKPAAADTVQPGLPNDLSGAIVNEGSITVDPFAGTAWTHRNDGLLINTGTIILEGDSNIDVDLFPVPQASLTNSGLLSKAGGTGSAFINVRLNNTGVVESQSGRLAIRDALQVDANTQTLSGGTWRSVAGGRVEFLQLAGLAVNEGTLALSGPGSEIVGLADIQRNNGTLTLEGGATLTTDAFINSGAVDIPDGLLESVAFSLDDAQAVLTIGRDGTIVVSGDLTNGGAGVVDSVVRSAGSGRDRSRMGRERGDTPPAPTIAATTLHNHAILRPGGTDEPGILVIDADLVCHPSSTIEIDLSGPALSDTLAVAGDVTLNGTLRVAVDPAYTPALGDSIAVLFASSISGSVAVIASDGASSLRWQPEVSSGELRLTAVCLADFAPPFGTLDLADIGAFIGAFTGGSPLADLNGDTFLDLTDLGLFITSFTGGCP